jgi:site-specific recombinase XerD
MSEQAKRRGIFQRPPGSGIWWISYCDSDGKRHREKIGSKSAAISQYEKKKTQVREGRLGIGNVLFSALVVDYLRSKGVDEKKAGRAGIVKEWFGGQIARTIRPQAIEQKIIEATKTPATFNRYRAVCSGIFALGQRNGKISVNPARLVKLRKENNARVRWLEPEEETALREAIHRLHPERGPELDLALHTGMRWSEQYGLKWEQVNLSLGLITVLRSKHGKKRYVQLNAVARQALERLRQKYGKTGLVCGDMRPSQHRKWWEQVIAEAKLHDFHWHDLRHTFASRLVMAGVDLRTVQELMGHLTIQVTTRYAHLAPSHLREAVERLAKVPEASGTETGTGHSEQTERQAPQPIQVQ